MFSTTFIESKSAAYWNTMPNFRRRRAHLRRRRTARRPRRRPRSAPLSGLSSPMRCFISTDFPCPDPPMMMFVWPRSMSRSMPAQHVLRAEGLVQPANADLPASRRERIAARRSRWAVRGVGRHDVWPEDVKDVDQEVVGDEDRDRACNDGPRRRKADLLGAAAHVEALEAGGHRERQAEDGRLDRSDDVVLGIGPVA